MAKSQNWRRRSRGGGINGISGRHSLYYPLSHPAQQDARPPSPIPWQRRMQRLASGGPFKVGRFFSSQRTRQLTPERTENNLFLVKRLIQRIDMRNPDPGPKRYTSLAWAAVLGNEETFEYLLNAGHDDQELSRVCYFPASTVRSF